MCTLVILHRPGHDWPMIWAANRDEMLDRPWRPPARHWPDRPGVVAGLDQLAGGSWLGLNDAGVVAGIMNRHGTLGPAAGMRSRGELVLAALQHRDAKTAAQSMSMLKPAEYRAFNLVIADRSGAFWVCHRTSSATQTFEIEELAPGYSMFTERDRNDTESARIRFNLPRFEEASVPRPERGDWSVWETLLLSRDSASAREPRGAMWIAPRNGFGTVCSSLLALPAAADKAHWRFADSGVAAAEFTKVAL